MYRRTSRSSHANVRRRTLFQRRPINRPLSEAHALLFVTFVEEAGHLAPEPLAPVFRVSYVTALGQHPGVPREARDGGLDGRLRVDLRRPDERAEERVVEVVVIDHRLGGVELERALEILRGLGVALEAVIRGRAVGEGLGGARRALHRARRGVDRLLVVTLLVELRSERHPVTAGHGAHRITPAAGSKAAGLRGSI